MEKPYR